MPVTLPLCLPCPPPQPVLIPPRPRMLGKLFGPGVELLARYFRRFEFDVIVQRDNGRATLSPEIELAESCKAVRTVFSVVSIFKRVHLVGSLLRTNKFYGFHDMGLHLAAVNDHAP